MAALIVHRPSPSSDTRPANLASAGSSTRAAAVKSSSHEAMTLPRMLLTPFIQRQVASTRVLVRVGPGRVAVPGEIELWQVRWHRPPLGETFGSMGPLL